MAHIISSEDDDTIHYVLSDSNSQFVLDSPASDNFENVICEDGTQAVYINGKLIPDEDGETFVLQEDTDQYYLQEDGILISDTQSNNGPTPILEQNDSPQIIQFIDEHGNLATAGPKIVYIQDEDIVTATNEADLSQYQLTTDDLEISGLQQLNAVKYETHQVINLDQLLKQQEDCTVLETNNIDINGYHYAVLEDGKLHVQPFPTYSSLQSFTEDKTATTQNIENITGRNLITGQKVSLKPYMNKIKKKETTRKKKSKDGLERLLNKRIDLGTTVSGKKLIGKIIRVEKKEKPPSQTNTEEEIASSSQSVRRYVTMKKAVPKIILNQISKTLGGIMNMDNARQKLENRNVFVKVTERTYDNELDKNVYYVSGYMVETIVIIEETGELLKDYYFETDCKEIDDTSIADLAEENCSNHESKVKSFPEVTHVDLFLTTQKEKQQVRVVLNGNISPPTLKYQCAYCLEELKTRTHLQMHVNEQHDQPLKCPNCAYTYLTKRELEEHHKYHTGQTIYFCTAKQGCNRYFTTLQNLEKHALTHSRNEFLHNISPCQSKNSTEVSNQISTIHPTRHVCEVCYEVFPTIQERDAHKKTHKGQIGASKVYSCNVCKRTFSRHSNLLRHLDIHSGNGELYSCYVCGSSYHFMSSLTRHIVQNHVQV